MIKVLHGVTISFDDQGQGHPILFIHGYPLNRALWKPQIEELSKSCRTIAIDLRGHGQSQPIPGPYSMEILADDCYHLLDALNIKGPVVLCGLSMGGYISMAFYRQYPSRVSGLILAATRSNSDSTEVRANRDLAIQLAYQKGAQAISDSMLPKMFAKDTYINNPDLVNHIRTMMASTSIEGIVGALNGMKDRTDSTSMLRSILVPTLIIHGDSDQLIPIQIAKEMHTAIPKSTFVNLPGTGHLLNLEQPELFSLAIMNFLADIRQA